MRELSLKGYQIGITALNTRPHHNLVTNLYSLSVTAAIAEGGYITLGIGTHPNFLNHKKSLQTDATVGNLKTDAVLNNLVVNG